MSEGITEGCSAVGDLLPLSTLSWSLLLIVSMLSTTQASSCVRPFSIQHGRVNVTETNRGSFPVGAVLQYSCDSGYPVDGPSIIVCTREGLWSSGPPRCLHNNYCVPPLEPENGGYTCHPSPCHRLTDGTMVEYFCDEGYTLKGDYKYVTCQKGEWNGPMEVSCVLSQGCVRPFSIQHGQVNVTETNRGSFPVGAVLQYSCDSGYTVDGPSIVVCTREGLWSSGPPRCLHNNLCTLPFVPKNGGYTCHPAPCHRLTDGTMVEYFCDEGYTLKGDYKYVTCQKGEWNGPMEVSCVLSQGCVRPFSIQHGQVNVTETNRGSFPVGAVLQYSCDSGYTVDGPSIVVCTREGLWSSGPPRCLHNNLCTPPFVPKGGGYTCHPAPCHRLTDGTVVEYFCGEGYTLKGDYKYVTCQNGQWNSPMLISCVLSQETHAAPVLGMNTMSIVATTASSVTLVLLLMVVFVLLQPKLKAFHHGRRDQGDSGQPVTIMVEGVQVTLPSYEEAVSGAGGAVLPRLLPQTQLESLEHVTTQTSTTQAQHTEISVVHQPSSSSSFSSSWSLEGAQGATAASSAFQSQNPDTSQQNSLLSLHDSEQNLADDIPLLKES